MRVVLQIHCEFEWSSKEADGQRCEICTEPCYMGCWELNVVVNRRRKAELDLFLCNACHDMEVNGS